MVLRGVQEHTWFEERQEWRPVVDQISRRLHAELREYVSRDLYSKHWIGVIYHCCQADLNNILQPLSNSQIISSNPVVVCCKHAYPDALLASNA